MLRQCEKKKSPPKNLGRTKFASVWTVALLTTSRRGEQRAHLEANVALLAAEAGQHEEDEGEEARKGDGHHCQGGRPRQLAQGGAICNARARSRYKDRDRAANCRVTQEMKTARR